MLRFGSALLTVVILLASLSQACAAEVPGTRPAHLAGELPTVPNDAAILSCIWAPGIDAGYVPQGITVADGVLKKLDAASGAVLSSYEMAIGVENISFDAQGRLWTVSEAGSLCWSRWLHAYPVLFSIDPARLG